jgi:hypothetical protein
MVVVTMMMTLLMFGECYNRRYQYGGHDCRPHGDDNALGR